MKRVPKHQILLIIPNDMHVMYAALTTIMIKVSTFILLCLKHVEMQRNKEVKNVIMAIRLVALTVEYNLDITVLKIKIQHLNA